MQKLPHLGAAPVLRLQLRRGADRQQQPAVVPQLPVRLRLPGGRRPEQHIRPDEPDIKALRWVAPSPTPAPEVHARCQVVNNQLKIFLILIKN